MVLKTALFQKDIGAGQTKVFVGSIVGLAGVTRIVKELRPNTPTGKLKLRIFLEEEEIRVFLSDVWTMYKLPIPENVELPEGKHYYIYADDLSGAANHIDIEVDYLEE